MGSGKVKWFNDAKGYGFKTLAEGQQVEFEVEAGNKGLHAASVHATA